MTAYLLCQTDISIAPEFQKAASPKKRVPPTSPPSPSASKRRRVGSLAASSPGPGPVTHYRDRSPSGEEAEESDGEEEMDDGGENDSALPRGLIIRLLYAGRNLRAAADLIAGAQAGIQSLVNALPILAGSEHYRTAVQLAAHHNVFALALDAAIASMNEAANIALSGLEEEVEGEDYEMEDNNE